MSDIPIIIPCYKNKHYVMHMINQLRSIRSNLHIIVLDNSPQVLGFPSEVTVIHSPQNEGPWVTPRVNKSVYDTLPSLYVITDPDLQMNINLPSDFLEQLRDLINIHMAYKVGMALDISEPHLMYSYADYTQDKSIVTHEQSFWENRIPDEKYELFNAPIDTTFALYNKGASECGLQIRVAGQFTARHLPWYIHNPVISKYQQLQQYTSSKYSHVGNFFIRTLNTEGIMAVKKRSVDFLVQRDNNEQFWTNYPTWEEESFNVYDAYLKSDGIMLDIGAWNGCTALYARTRCKHVYTVEADPMTLQKLQYHVALNDASSDITVIPMAIYSKSHALLKFGKNENLPNSRLDDSTSQILTQPSKEYHLVKTISPDDLVRTYVSDPSKLCLVKVDIEGGEEDILDQLWSLHQTYRVPLYVSFHINWWKNKDLDRFAFITPEQKQHLQSFPFSSLLFK